MTDQYRHLFDSKSSVIDADAEKTQSHCNRRLLCLILADFETLTTSTVERHLLSLRDLSFHAVELVHAPMLNWLNINIAKYDVIVFHYSVVIARGYHFLPQLRARLANSKATKVLFIQDEYRWIDATANAIAELGISILFTVVNRDVVERIYHHDWLRTVRKELTLTGFVDDALLSIETPSYEDRRMDVVYRARKVPFWLGAFAIEKWTIGDRFAKDAQRFGLMCDIESDESARLYGHDWITFIGGSRAVLGTESGASVCDFSGDIRTSVEDAVRETPNLSFSDIQKAFLADDGEITIHVISPRIFEAAALRTLMINYPGDYSGRLVPWRHYVPLSKDHSNMEQVVNVIKDPVHAKEIIDTAYEEVARNKENSFRSMVEHFDQVLTEEVAGGADVGRASRQPKASRVLETASRLDILLRRQKRKLQKVGKRKLESILPKQAVAAIQQRLTPKPRGTSG